MSKEELYKAAIDNQLDLAYRYEMARELQRRVKENDKSHDE